MPAGGTFVLNRQAVRGEFAKNLEQASRAVEMSRLCLMTRSGGASERYAFGDSAPALQKFLGKRKKKQLGSAYVDISNDEWDSSIDLRVKDLRRDQTGTIRRRIGELATRAGYLPWRLVQQILLGTIAPLAYDGKVLISATHSYGNSGTQTNALTATEVPTLNIGTANAPTPAELAQIIGDVIGYMMTYKDDEGMPLHETASQFLVVCHAKHIGSFNTAIKANALAAGQTNPVPMQGVSIDVVPGLLLTDDTKFRIFRTDSENVKPFIFQTEVDPTVAVSPDDSDYVRQNKQYEAVCDYECGIGIGEPLSAAECTMS